MTRRITAGALTRTASAALSCLAAGTGFAATGNTGLSGPQNGPQMRVPQVYERPVSEFRGQHFTNSLGCTYSRTQAPGHPVVWHLLVNTRVPGCPNTVPGA